MPAFQQPFEPIALPDQFIRAIGGKTETTLRVDAVEQLPFSDTPLNFGSVSSGGTATDASGNTEQAVEELDMNSGNLGQFRIDPISPVRVQVRQTGRQERRFQNETTVGAITVDTPANMREVFVLGTENPHLVVENQNQYDLDKSLISFDGFRYLTTEVEEADVSGQPAVVPVDKLTVAAQTARASSRRQPRRGQTQPRQGQRRAD